MQFYKTLPLPDGIVILEELYSQSIYKIDSAGTRLWELKAHLQDQGFTNIYRNEEGLGL